MYSNEFIENTQDTKISPAHKDRYRTAIHSIILTQLYNHPRSIGRHPAPPKGVQSKRNSTANPQLQELNAAAVAHSSGSLNFAPPQQHHGLRPLAAKKERIQGYTLLFFSFFCISRRDDICSRLALHTLAPLDADFSELGIVYICEG